MTFRLGWALSGSASRRAQAGHVARGRTAADRCRPRNG